MPYISPGFICHTEGCYWAITAEMVRQRESDMAEKMTPTETLAFFASVIKSGEPWTPACQQAMDDAMARLAQPAQAVDVGAIREVIAELYCAPYRTAREQADKLTRAIGNAQAEGVTAKLEAANALLREWLPPPAHFVPYMRGSLPDRTYSHLQGTGDA
jgi:hypothetical protein